MVIFLGNPKDWNPCNGSKVGKHDEDAEQLEAAHIVVRGEPQAGRQQFPGRPQRKHCPGQQGVPKSVHHSCF